MMEKTCINCQRFIFHQDGPYSEETPDVDCYLGCSAGKWEIHLFEDEQVTLRSCLLLAQNCHLFKEQIDATA